MALQNRFIEFTDGEQLYEAYVSWDNSRSPSPGVLVLPTWMGRDDFTQEKADKLAALGYVGVAIDIYGKDRGPESLDEAPDWMMPLKKDRDALKLRLHAALDALAALPEVADGQVAAMGFCFGGLCALDLARTRPDLKAAASFHGLLDRPENWPMAPIKSKVLIMHGWEDPMAQPESVLAVTAEMTEAGADWQLHAYGHTVHAFTNPNAATEATHYKESADRRSWQALSNFLAETF